MSDARFEHYWRSTIRPGTPPDLVDHWRRYVLSGTARGVAVVDQVSRHTDLSGSMVLDIGCGYGGTCIAFAQRGAQVTGVDIEDVYLRGASIWAGEQQPEVIISFVGAKAERLPFPGASFDVVVCADLMEHVDDHGLVAGEIGRVLRDGGVAYVSFPNRLSPRNLRSDPHYGMLGVSLLPRSLGTWYVSRLRKRSPTYSVGLFPIAETLRRSLSRHGMTVVWQNPRMHRNLGPLNGLARLVRDCTYPKVEWILRRRSAGAREL